MQNICYGNILILLSCSITEMKYLLKNIWFISWFVKDLSVQLFCRILWHVWVNIQYIYLFFTPLGILSKRKDKQWNFENFLILWKWVDYSYGEFGYTIQNSKKITKKDIEKKPNGGVNKV